MLYTDAFHKLRKDKLSTTCFIIIVCMLILGFLSLIPGFAPKQSLRGIDPVTKIDRHYHPPTLLLASGLVQEVNGKPLTEAQEEAFDGGFLNAAAWQAPLGRDQHGRSVLALLMHAIRLAFIIGFVTTVISTLIALPIGALAGYFGGITDEIVVWFYTTLASIPQLLLLIGLIASLPQDLRNDSDWALYAVLVVIGITTWVGLARLVRAEVLKHKNREYVQAARSLGFNHGRTIFVHILPNISHIAIIMFTINFISSVNLEVFLSFIGIGIPAEALTFGQMIARAKQELTRDPSVWWPLTSASILLFILSLAFSFFGDALRDALDPKLSTSA